MIKEYFKGLARTYLKKIVISIIIIISLILVFTSSWYLVSGDKSLKAEITTKKYKSDYVSVSPTAGIVSNLDYMSNPSGSESSEDDEEKYGYELFQYLSELGYDLEEYFDELDNQVNINNVRKILNAEMVTQFPYIEGLGADKVNGVIRFKRISSDGNENQDDYSEDADANVSSSLQNCLKYVEETQLLNWVTEYNEDNSNVEAKNNAMNSFTLVSSDGYYEAQVAILKEVKVTTNDEHKYVSEIGDESSDVNDIRSGLDLTFQDASYTVSTDPTTGDTVYTFQVLELIYIDYVNMIEKYTMPSDFLFQLLTYTEDLDFVLSVADLAYKSTIVVGIYEDNSSIVTSSKEYDYNRQEKHEYAIETYVPRIFGDYGIFKENEEVSSNFESFGNSVLLQYPNSNDVNTSEEYKDFFRVDSSNLYDTSVYNDTVTHLYEYLVDADGFPAITTEPKKYYLNYYFYENTPVCDLNVADIWYGYYSKNYNYNELEMTETVEEINPSEYVQWEYESKEDENLKNNIINIFSGSVNSYVDSGVFDDEILGSFDYPEFKFYYPNFEFTYDEFEYPDFEYPEFVPDEIPEDADDSEKEGIEASNRNAKEAYEAAKQAAEDKYNEDYEAAKKAYDEEYEAAYDEAYEEYEEEKQEAYDEEYQEYSEARNAAAEEHLEAGRNGKKEELKLALNSSTVTVVRTKSARDVNVIEKISTNMLSSQEKYSYTEVAAENFHFSKILKNNAKAYNALEDIGGWLIESLESTESTKNVVEKVKYLLNQAYNSNEFGTITSEDLLSLYTTTSANVNIPTNGNFLETAKACHDYLRLNNYYYSSAANKTAGNYVQDGTSTGRYVPVILGEPQNERYIDCSAYVTWVLMQTGHISPEQKWQYTSYVLYANNADGLGFETMEVSGIEDLTDEDLSTNGYIIVKNGHTEIYAGKDADGYYYTYNAGSTSSIRKEVSKYTESQFYNHFNSAYKILIVGEA